MELLFYYIRKICSINLIIIFLIYIFLLHIILLIKIYAFPKQKTYPHKTLTRLWICFVFMWITFYNDELWIMNCGINSFWEFRKYIFLETLRVSTLIHHSSFIILKFITHHLSFLIFYLKKNKKPTRLTCRFYGGATRIWTGE